LIALTAINFVCLYDRVQISALAQPIKEEFGFSDTQLGLLTGTAFGLTFAACAIPLGWVSDRTNRVKLLATVLAFWSVMTGMVALAQGFWQLALCRIGVAAGESAFTPTAHSLLADYYPPQRRGLAIGVETAGGTIGIMVGLAMAGWLAAAYGWRVALLAAGLPGLVLATFLLLKVREPVRGQAALSSTDARRPLRGRVTRAYGWLVVAAVCNSTMTTGWTQWLPAFFTRTYDLPIGVVGVSVGVASGLGLTCGHIAGGWLSAASAARGHNVPFVWCALIVLGTLPGYALAIWAPNAGLALGGVFCSTAVAGMMAPFIFGAIQNSCDPQFRASAVAFALAFVTIGSYAVMPVVIGALSDVFAPEYGKASLRMALNAFLLVPLFCSGIYVIISRTFRLWTPGVAASVAQAIPSTASSAAPARRV
jgi:predicted MFS family arabinose efflux permease